MMTAKQVKNIRESINAAHKAGNLVKANELQAVLHNHLIKESDAFLNSASGKAHMNYLLNKFD